MLNHCTNLPGIQRASLLRYDDDMPEPENVIEGKKATTSCAVLTGPGRSAIAVVQLQGPAAQRLLLSCFEPATKAKFVSGQIRYGVWGPRDSEAGESVVVTPLARETEFEIHCHGGPAAVQRIVDDLQQAGAVLTPASPQSSSVLISEATDVLIRCTTARTAAIAMDQVRGAMFDWGTSFLNQHDSGQLAEIQTQAAAMLRHAVWGTRLTEPFRVVLTGPPNVGKSSLLNQIVGYDRSITFDVAGTTRDVLHAETVIEGLPIRISDTAGIRDSAEPIERLGIAKAQQAIETADLILQVTEPGLDMVSLSPTRPTMLILNKSDLLPDDSPAFPHHLRTNAISGAGIAELLAAIVSQLVGTLPPPGSPVPITIRQTNILEQLVAAESCEAATVKLQALMGGRT
jgi:tRNA modification GTPase